jgi:hypothetical protein
MADQPVSRCAFATTHWSVVLTGPWVVGQRWALEQLTDLSLSHHAEVRRRGHDHHAAWIWRRACSPNFSPEHSYPCRLRQNLRFRNYLLTALNHFSPMIGGTEQGKCAVAVTHPFRSMTIRSRSYQWSHAIIDPSQLMSAAALSLLDATLRQLEREFTSLQRGTVPAFQVFSSATTTKTPGAELGGNLGRPRVRSAAVYAPPPLPQLLREQTAGSSPRPTRLKTSCGVFRVLSA